MHLTRQLSLVGASQPSGDPRIMIAGYAEQSIRGGLDDDSHHKFFFEASAGSMWLRHPLIAISCMTHSLSLALSASHELL